MLEIEIEKRSLVNEALKGEYFTEFGIVLIKHEENS
jgi:hypothetical protein